MKTSRKSTTNAVHLVRWFPVKLGNGEIHIQYYTNEWDLSYFPSPIPMTFCRGVPSRPNFSIKSWWKLQKLELLKWINKKWG